MQKKAPLGAPRPSVAHLCTLSLALVCTLLGSCGGRVDDGPLRPLRTSAAAATYDACGGATPLCLTTSGLTTSPDGVRHTIYSGRAPSWDDMPLGVDVTLPDTPKPAAGYPVVVLLGGWTDSRKKFESPTRATTGEGLSVPIADHWNNMEFAARGYAVLNLDPRGWNESCGLSGKDARCAGLQSWVHLAEPRYEIHDVQHLLGVLADQQFVDPAKIVVSGFSYGGIQAWLLALQNNVVAASNGTPGNRLTADGASQGTDIANPDGPYNYVPWTSPNGKAMRISGAVPMATPSSLVNSLIPNGRDHDVDGSQNAFALENLFANPVGLTKQVIVVTLLSAAAELGFLAPPLVDRSSDLRSWNERLTAGPPYFYDPLLDPVLFRLLKELHRRSPVATPSHGSVPIFQIQGFTDTFQPVKAALQMRSRLGAGYPIESFYADIGHPNATNRADHWAQAHARALAFVDTVMSGGAPSSTAISAMVTSCNAPLTSFTPTARVVDWTALPRSTQTYEVQTSGAGALVLTNGDVSSGEATSALAQPNLTSFFYTGTNCVMIPHVPTPPNQPAAHILTWLPSHPTERMLAGSPTVEVGMLSVGGPESEIVARLWDICVPEVGVSCPTAAPTQVLVSRAIYHSVAGASANLVRFELSPNLYAFAPGHRIGLELVGNDPPYYQRIVVPFETAVTSVRLTMPMTTCVQPSCGPL